jgi:hypothetical protein
MSAIIVAPPSASTAKTMASAPRTFGLRFGLVDGQGSSAEIRPIESRDSLVGFTGIGHFHEPEPTRASSIPVGHERDLFDRTVRLKEISQFGFGCAVGQIPNIKVLHRNSSFSKSCMGCGGGSLARLFRANQQFLGVLAPSNLLFAFSVKSGLVAIACRHIELPLIRLLPGIQPSFSLPAAWVVRIEKEKPLCKKPRLSISQSRRRTLLE